MHLARSTFFCQGSQTYGRADLNLNQTPLLQKWWLSLCQCASNILNFDVQHFLFASVSRTILLMARQLALLEASTHEIASSLSFLGCIWCHHHITNKKTGTFHKKETSLWIWTMFVCSESISNSLYVSLLVKYAMSSTNTLTYNNSNGLYLVCPIGCEIINKVLSHSTLELVQGVLVHVHTTFLSSLIYCMTHHQKSYVAKSTNNYLTTIEDALSKSFSSWCEPPRPR